MVYAEYLQTNRFLSLVRESKRKYSSAKSYIYNGLTFDIYNSGRVFISGSLHKYWNNGHHNHNDFSYTDVLSTIEDLVSKFYPLHTDRRYKQFLREALMCNRHLEPLIT